MLWSQKVVPMNGSSFISGKLKPVCFSVDSLFDDHVNTRVFTFTTVQDASYAVAYLFVLLAKANTSRPVYCATLDCSLSGPWCHCVYHRHRVLSQYGYRASGLGGLNTLPWEQHSFAPLKSPPNEEFVCHPDQTLWSPRMPRQEGLGELNLCCIMIIIPIFTEL